MARPKKILEELCKLHDDAPVDTPEAGTLADLSPISMYRLRCNGEGPPYERLGQRIVYRKGDVIAWRNSRRFRDRAHELDEIAKRQRGEARP